MKSWFFPVLVLGCVFSFGWWSAQSIAQESTLLQEEIRLVDQAVQREDWLLAQNLLAQSHQHWDRQQPLLCAVASHTYLGEIEAMYLRAMAFCQTQEPTEFRAELADLHHQLQVLGDMEQLNLCNIL